ncbi:MAG: cation diffusion facilitator family transporter [Actinobacteria bacterium]|nr:cation diffusion facilitator family transporter [Actinomycetota bacterium]MTA63815.1 cation diffusion facilitator family transporter [Actinomycetota bacterium]
MSASGGKKAIIAALSANLGIAVIKFIGFVLTGASSMLSEAIHSVADTGNQALLLLGRRQADKDSDDLHQFGYGRERFFWAFVVAVVLFALGSVFSLYEGIHKIQHPEEITSPQIAFAILIFSMLLEGYSLRTAVVESNHLRGTNSWWGFIRHSRVPELPVVLLEDFGAMTGLAVAFAAVSLSVVTGNGIYDGIGSVVIGLILGVIAVILSIEMKSLLIGEPALAEDQGKLLAAMSSSPGVVRIIHERTEYIGAEQVLLAAKVEFDSGLSMTELADAINIVEANVRAAVPIITLIYIEPDITRVS